MSLIRTLLLIVLAALVILIVGSTTSYLAWLMPRDGYLAQGIIIAKVDVGGLSEKQARSAVREVLERRLETEIVWHFDNRRLKFTLRELGVAFDLESCLKEALCVGRDGEFIHRVGTLVQAVWEPIIFEPSILLSINSAKAQIRDLVKEVTREPSNAYLRLKNGRILRYPHRDGCELDVEKTLAQLQQIIPTQHNSEAKLPLKIKKPQITSEDLQDIDCLLSTYSTRFNAQKRNRTHNIKVAAEALSGLLIAPGDIFSFNEIVGQRSTARGYKTAPIYSGGRIVPGTGGGVCQVSTTTYNAFLLAGLKVLQRSSHSMPVRYVPAGRDATVAYGVVDLQAKNLLSHPIYLLAGVKGNRIWVSVLGNSSDEAQVTLASKKLETIAYPTVEKEDPSLPSGKRIVEQKGEPGTRALVTRKIVKAGKIIAEEVISRDYYRPISKIVRIGPKPKPETLPQTAKGKAQPFPSEPEAKASKTP